MAKSPAAKRRIRCDWSKAVILFCRSSVHRTRHSFCSMRDGRVVFVIPYLDDYSLVGTTEEEYSGDLDAPQISESEVSYC